VAKYARYYIYISTQWMTCHSIPVPQNLRWVAFTMILIRIRALRFGRFPCVVIGKAEKPLNRPIHAREIKLVQEVAYLMVNAIPI
jgi:hypothetical protein